MSRTKSAIRKLAVVAIVGLAAQGSVSGMEQLGGFTLELDAPSPRSREKCATIVISNFGKLPDRRVRLIARSPERAAKPDYDSLQIVAMPASRVGEARLCSNHLQSLMRPAAHAGPVAVEVAVYRITGQEPAAGRWAGAPDENARLSEWLPIPQKALGSQVLAGRVSQTR